MVTVKNISQVLLEVLVMGKMNFFFKICYLKCRVMERGESQSLPSTGDSERVGSGHGVLGPWSFIQVSHLWVAGTQGHGPSSTVSQAQ